MKVKEIMAHPAITVSEDTTLEEIARLMLDNHIGCVPVVDANSRIIGIITESDFAAKEKSFPFSVVSAPQILGQWLSKEGLERIYQESKNVRAGEIMNRRLITVNENDPIEKAVRLMLEHDVNRLPVISGGKPVGVIARHDLLRFLTGRISPEKI